MVEYLGTIGSVIGVRDVGRQEDIAGRKGRGVFVGCDVDGNRLVIWPLSTISRGWNKPGFLRVRSEAAGIPSRRSETAIDTN